MQRTGECDSLLIASDSVSRKMGRDELFERSLHYLPNTPLTREYICSHAKPSKRKNITCELFFLLTLKDALMCCTFMIPGRFLLPPLFLLSVLHSSLAPSWIIILLKLLPSSFRLQFKLLQPYTLSTDFWKETNYWRSLLYMKNKYARDALGLLLHCICFQKRGKRIEIWRRRRNKEKFKNKQLKKFVSIVPSRLSKHYSVGWGR